MGSRIRDPAMRNPESAKKPSTAIPLRPSMRLSPCPPSG